MQIRGTWGTQHFPIFPLFFEFKVKIFKNLKFETKICLWANQSSAAPAGNPKSEKQSLKLENMVDAYDICIFPCNFIFKLLCA